MPTLGLGHGDRDVPRTPRRTSSWSSFFGGRRKQQHHEERHEVIGTTSNSTQAPGTEPHQWSINDDGDVEASFDATGGKYWGSVVAGERDQDGSEVEYLHGPELASIQRGEKVAAATADDGPAREGATWGWMDLKSWDRPDQWAPDGWIQTVPNGPLVAHQRSQSLDCHPIGISSSSTPPPTSSSFRTTPTPRRKSFFLAMDRIDSISDSNHSTPTPNTPTRISPSGTSRPTTPLTPLSARTRSPTPTRTTSGHSRLRSASIASSLSFASTASSMPHSNSSHSNPNSATSSPSKLQNRSRSLSLRINTTFDEQGRRVLSSVRRRSVAQDGSAPPLPVHKLKKQFGIGSDDESEDGKGPRHGGDDDGETEGEGEETLLSEDNSSQCSTSPSSPYPPSPYSPTFSSETEGESTTSLSSFSRTSSLSRTISSTSASSISLSHQRLGPRRTPSFSLSRKGTPPKVLRRKSLAEGSMMGGYGHGFGGFTVIESGSMGGDTGIRRSASQTDYGTRSGASMPQGMGTGGDYFSLGMRVREKEMEWERERERVRDRQGEKTRWEPDDGADYGHSLARTRPLLRVVNPDLVLEAEPRTIVAPVPISLPPTSNSSPPSVMITSRQSKLLVPSKDVFVGWAL